MEAEVIFHIDRGTAGLERIRRKVTARGEKVLREKSFKLARTKASEEGLFVITDEKESYIYFPPSQIVEVEITGDIKECQ